MTRVAIILGYVIGLLALPNGSALAQKMPLELLTISGVEAYATSNDITTIEELLDHLPDTLLNNYVLLEDSTSRQRPSTVRKPRIVMFLPDGSFFMGIATNEDSQGYNDAEMLESRSVNQTWKLGALRLGADDRFIHTAGKRVGEEFGCVGCHGSNSRPIWGSYPTWPGAFANGAGHDLTRDQATALNEALDESGVYSNVRLQKLNWLKRSGWSEGQGFNLPDRHRGLNNEGMNDAVGARHANNLWKRMIAAEHAELLMMTVMFHRHGFGDGITGAPEIKADLAETLDEIWEDRGLDFPNATVSDKALLLLGLTPYNDLYVARGLHQLSDPEREQSQIAGWNYIALYLGDFFIVRFTQHLLSEHPELGIGRLMTETDYEYSDAYTDMFAYFRDNVRFMWELDLSDRLSHLRSETAPTVGLRYKEYGGLFTDAFQAKIIPVLIPFAEAKIAEYESE